MKIIGTGLSGLVGSRVVELLSGPYSFENLSLETGVDITKKDIVDHYINASQAPWVVHFAAKTDVDGSEAERDEGEKSSTWKINVAATQYLVDACRRTHKKFLYISTDFVFDGKKDKYSEDDVPNPLGWYGITKYEGEKRVQTLPGSIIVRISNPYGGVSSVRPDFVHRIIQRLTSGEGVVAPTDQEFVPTYIDDIAMGIKKLIEKNCSGVYHVVGSQSISPYDAACKIAGAFELDRSLIGKTTFAQYFDGRAPRPFHTVLRNDKITKLGVRMSTFDHGLATIKLQLPKK